MKKRDKIYFKLGCFLITSYLVFYFLFFIFRPRLPILYPNFILIVGFILMGYGIFKLLNSKFKSLEKKIIGIKIDRLFFIGIILIPISYIITIILILILEFIPIITLFIFMHRFTFTLHGIIPLIGIYIIGFVLYLKTLNAFEKNEKLIQNSSKYLRLGTIFFIISILLAIINLILMNTWDSVSVILSEMTRETFYYQIMILNVINITEEFFIYLFFSFIALAIYKSIPEKFFIFKLFKIKIDSHKFYKIGFYLSLIPIIIWFVINFISALFYQRGFITIIGEGVNRTPQYILLLHGFGYIILPFYYFGLLILGINIYESLRSDSCVVTEIESNSSNDIK